MLRPDHASRQLPYTWFKFMLLLQRLTQSCQVLNCGVAAWSVYLTESRVLTLVLYAKVNYLILQLHAEP